MAKSLQDFSDPADAPHLIRNKYGPIEFDKERTKQYSDLLANPKNCLIFLSSKEFEKEKFETIQYWYKVPYATETISEQLLQVCTNQIV